MSKKKTIYCNNRSVGRLLSEAKSGGLIDAGREEDRRLFFDDHLDECRACRDEMIDHANQLALSEIAEESGVEVELVVEGLRDTANRLRDLARDQGVSFEEVILGTIRRRSHALTNSNRMRAVSSIPSRGA